jgi:hypothetical protein
VEEIEDLNPVTALPVDEDVGKVGDDEFAGAHDATFDTHIGELAKAAGDIEQAIENGLGRVALVASDDAHLVVELNLGSLAPDDLHLPSRSSSSLRASAATSS